MANEKPKMAIDLQHHISDFARARSPSPLKGLQKYLKPGSIILAGGLPSPAYFPFGSIAGEALDPCSFPLQTSESLSSFSWLWNLFGADSASKEKTSTVTIPKYPSDPDDLSLSVALQYGPAVGLTQLQKVIYELTMKVHNPGYEHFTTLIHTGNTDGWARAVATLCNKGEAILTSEWTYPSAMYTMMPYEVSVAPVAIDSQGMRSDNLLSVLKGWDQNTRGAPRPHVMYIVPNGQNPSGATMGAARKKEIYDICVQYDVIIVEDDPYFFLQEGPYVSKLQRKGADKSRNLKEMPYIGSLQPSFLKFDYQGRVVRLDSFSKTIAPGSRLGWFTCNPIFSQPFEMHGETSTQSPCGFGQSLITQLLLHWKYEGYIRWLRGLTEQYTTRRDYFIDYLHEEFDLQRSMTGSGAWEGSEYYTAYERSGDQQMKEKPGKVMFSFVPPTSGMFIWMKLHFDGMASPAEDEESLETQLWTKLAEAGVLVAPGWIFSADVLTGSEPDAGEGHFRISFSNAEFDEMKRAIKIFGKVIREFSGDH